MRYSDRRERIRFPAAIPIEICDAQQMRWPGTIRDLSLGGAFITSEGTLSVGAQVTLCIPLVGEMPPIQLAATIRRVTTAGDDGHGYGVAFARNSVAERRELHQIMRTLLDTFAAQTA